QLVWANVDTVITSVIDEDSANAPAAALLAQLGVPHAYVPHAGERFASDGQVLREHVLDPMLRVFDHPLPAPHRFSYKTTDRAFGVWGYEFDVDRPNTEFLSVLGARLDGTDLILAGTGTVTVTTPATFEPGRTMPVVLTPDPHTEDPRASGQALAPLRPVELLIEADAHGRLTFEVELGGARVHDEDEILLEHGQFQFPHVRVEVGEPGTPAAAVESGTPWLWRSCTSEQCELPEPFSGWNVRVHPWAGNPQVLTLDFDSPVLGLRARNYVHLPDAYLVEDRPFPVLYFLHGTIDGDPPPSANYQSWNMRFQEPRLLEAQQYVVVSADMNDSSWCFKCWWIDHLDPPVGDIPWLRNFPLTEVPAETHLHQELLPLIEAMFRVRDDRGGRGVIGNSMGGGGAATQGFRHPDTFAFVGGVSGWQYDVASSYNYHMGPETAAIYFRRQGYPYREEGEIHYRNVSPSELGSHLPGADVELVTTVGDGCVDFLDSSNHCGHRVDLLSLTEALARRDLDHVSPKYWTQVGVPHTVGSYAGTHYFPDGDVYESWYVDRINTTFASERVDPFRFAYKSAYPTFEAWGYDFVVERPNVEFLNVLGAQLDGRSFSLAGTGRVTVTTPAVFLPNHVYRVVITAPDGTTRELAVRTGKDRRLVMELELGPPREDDERRELVEAGIFPFPITRVDVLGGPPATPGPK
ncbi:MAG TPA: alpha/beta hydrolase-fold protein, partial [Nitriliruptorales bacterium]